MDVIWVSVRLQRVKPWACLLVICAGLACSNTGTNTLPTSGDTDTSASARVREDADAANFQDATVSLDDATTLLGRDEGPAGESDASTDTGRGLSPAVVAPEVVVGTWNLHSFSEYGLAEYRIEDIAAEISALGADIVGIQELKIAKNQAETDPQAWDSLLAEIQDMEGFHNPWNPMDSVVGFLYRPETTTVLATKALFVGDWWPFPRAPMEATLRVQKGQGQVTFRVIVLHLKAFPDGLDRRIEACTKLDTYIQSQVGMPYLLIGDLNDNPRDALESNAFATSFLAAGSDYAFVTLALPEEAVTSLGYYQTQMGDGVPGEFLDHVVANDILSGFFSDLIPSVKSYPLEDYAWYEETYSDHFPVVVVLNP
jgi:endonuclease/exonuclease/phosphatase family metal-dependent hydrolase